MDIDLNTLLVALMYVTILSMGIGNLITSFSSLRLRTSNTDLRLIASWEFLLLIYHLHLFWLTRALLEVEDWRFYGFLFIIAGPILMYICANLAVDTASQEESSVDAHVLSRRFFILFAITQVWILSSGWLIGGSFAAEDLPLMAMTILLLALAGTQQEKPHIIGAVLAWILLITSIIISVSHS